MEVFLHRARRLLSRCRRARRGSVTIEACISVVAFLFVILLILLKQKEKSSRLPAGPFVLLAMAAAMLLGV